MNNTIYIVRHGQDEDNASGILNGHRDQPLTKIGEMQAGELAKEIQDADMQFDVILSSPLKRTFLTAEIISKGQKTEPVVEDLLIERNFGMMTGKPVASITELCSPDVLETEHINYFLSPEGAETFPDLMVRGNKLLKKLDEQYDNKKILLVTHGDMGKMVYASYYELEWRDVLIDFHFGNSEMLLLSKDISKDDAHIFKIKQHHKSK